MKPVSDPPMNVLILEDDDLEAVLTTRGLNKGWLGEITINRCISVKESIEFLSLRTPHILLLDLNVLDSDGLSTIKSILDFTQNKIPAIAMTSVAEQSVAVEALNLGVQDYIVKDHYTPESLAKSIRFARARHKTKSSALELDKLRIDLSNFTVKILIEGAWLEIELTPNEIKLLNFFAKHSNQVFSRDQLMSKIWGENVAISERVVDGQISRLRKKLETSKYNIVSVRGQGYLFKENE